MITLLKDGKPLTDLSFPNTYLGKTSYLEAEIQNDTAFPVTIELVLNDPDMGIVKFPKSLMGGERQKIIFSFSPKKNREKPLISECGFRVVQGW